MDFPKLNFPEASLRINKEGDKNMILDRLRGCWLIYSPEEWVRQHTIFWITSLGVDPFLITQEYPVSIGSLTQRADIVVFNKNMNPLMLVECKAHSVAIDHSTLSQAIRYNSVVGAKYLMLTNGKSHFFYLHNTSSEYSALDSVPNLHNL